MSDDNGSASLTPTDATFVGDVSEAVRGILQKIQHNQGQIQFEIGGLEVRKAQLLSNLEGLRGQAKHILESEAVRLGIPPERSWQITPEGKVHLTG